MKDQLIDALRKFEAEHVFNPWSDLDPTDTLLSAPQKRCERLLSHFECKPKFLLVGEAPGYQGCHFSGVPFTSERLLLAGSVPRSGILDQRITTRPLPWSEPSASIVWGALNMLGIAERTVMWNAFPWHPHKSGDLYSNRAPRFGELAAGKPVLRMVLERFAGAQVVAIGNLAEAALNGCGVRDVVKVRHPANGGARLFRQGLEALVRRAA